jgi:FAD:protein FMN transferase
MRAEHFRAMGSAAGVYVVGGGPELLATARRRIDDLEARWSRFRPDSELNRLNARADGEPHPVSPDTFSLLQRAVEAWRLTGGLCDPTVLGDVLRAGYRASFDDLPATVTAGASDLGRGAAGIELDPVARTARLPVGVGVDPGGVGKGFAADLVVAELLDAGAEGACVNLGGDLRVAGAAPAESWVVAVDHPWRPDPAGVVHLRDGAVATSSRMRRRWSTPTGPAHHLIDPRDGRPAAGDVLAASAVAAEGWQAEAFAKLAFLVGWVDGLERLDEHGVGALLVDDDGGVLVNRSMHRFLDGVPAPGVLEVQR